MKRTNKLLSIFLTLSIATTAVCSCADQAIEETEVEEPSEETTEESGLESTVEPTEESADESTGESVFEVTREEGIELMLGNEDYYNGFSQNDLDFKMQEEDATMEEYLEFAADQVTEFSDEQQAKIEESISRIEQTLYENGYQLPPLDEIVFIATTMNEELGAGGYTHGTQIYLGDYLVDALDDTTMDYFIAHELFHCLTRCNPDFRAEMYSLINFTVTGEDFPIPDSVFEYHISNPDVEHHDSYATFHINGEDIDCFVDFVTTAHFAEVHTDFFAVGTTALIPVDGTDIYYTPEEADNFDEVFGTNTGYVIDPEECMADNFAYALVFGIEGPANRGYSNPEIIEGILTCLGAEFVG